MRTQSHFSILNASGLKATTLNTTKIAKQCLTFSVRQMCKLAKTKLNQVLLVFHETKKVVQDGPTNPHLARFLSISGVFLQKVNNGELWVYHCVPGPWL